LAFVDGLHVMQLVLLFHLLKKRVHDSLSARYGCGLLCRSALKQRVGTYNQVMVGTESLLRATGGVGVSRSAPRRLQS
jgi:hypothetical protein